MTTLALSELTAKELMVLMHKTFYRWSRWERFCLGLDRSVYPSAYDWAVKRADVAHQNYEEFRLAYWAERELEDCWAQGDKQEEFDRE